MHGFLGFIVYGWRDESIENVEDLKDLLLALFFI